MQRRKKKTTRGVYLTETFGDADVEGSIWASTDAEFDMDGMLVGEDILAQFSTKKTKKKKDKVRAHVYWVGGASACVYVRTYVCTLRVRV